jgi:Tol biopolymer transport system component
MGEIDTLTVALSDRYEIVREIGAGGMATVFLAHDLKHERQVALKVLKPELGAVLGVERFLSEIKVTANLQHPNLLPLFDSGEAGGLLFYVMPYVEGESLRARLDREKQLPVDEAVRMAVAVAGALAYAHEHGVIHRDLKPENILIQAGQPVIADFGIALAVSNAGGQRVTQTGLSLGTPQYMSPEQATGDRTVDGRTDIYSLGAMTYEMLTGEPPHAGTTAQSIIAKLMTEEVRPLTVLRRSVPPHVDAAVRHALEKLAADRFGTANDFAAALQGRGVAADWYRETAARSAVAPPASRSRWGARAGWVVAAVATMAAAWGFLRPGPVADDSVVRFILATPDSEPTYGVSPWPAAISPDGRTVVYAVGTNSGDATFRLLRVNELAARPVPGTVGGSQPLFSPDGKWIAFEANGKLRKIGLDGSAATTIADGAQSNDGATWTIGDEIVLGADASFRGLSHVSAAGGKLAALTTPDTARGETDHWYPLALDDGRTIVFAIVHGAAATAHLAVTSLDGGDITRLDLAGLRPLAMLDEFLVYVQADGAVMAVGLDVRTRRVTGPPIPVLDPVPAGNGNAAVYISSGGGLIASSGGQTAELAWIDRNGVAIPAGHATRGSLSSPRQSPDGHRVALAVADGASSDIWVENLDNGTLTRLTTIQTAVCPVWSLDGRHVYYIATGSDGKAEIRSISAGGGEPSTKVADIVGEAEWLDASPDGRTLLYDTWNDNSYDVYVAPLDSPGTTHGYLTTRASDQAPTMSPDGRWVAVVSGDFNAHEVYLRSYPDPSARVAVSTGGGVDWAGVGSGPTPRWSADGKTLYYQAGNSLIAARLSMSASGVAVLGRDTVFAGVTLNHAPVGLLGLDVSRDGTRFLGLVAERTVQHLVVVPNWIAELRAKLEAAGRK